VAALAYGVVRLYRRLFTDGQTAWEGRFAELKADREEDRIRWDTDRADMRATIDRLEERMARCHEENEDLRAQVGELRGQVGGLRFQLELLRSQGE